MLREKSIKVSPKHGVNPALVHCFICGADMGVALLGKLKGDKEAPRDISDPSMICPECQKQIEAGNHFIIEAKDGQSGQNPERTGRYVCLRKGALQGIDHPINYMEKTLFSKIFDKFLSDGQEDLQQKD